MLLKQLCSAMKARYSEKMKSRVSKLMSYHITIFTQKPTFNYPYCKVMIAEGER